VPSVHTLTREARQRLRAIEEFSELGSGFNIAMRDLDIRGAGSLLGAEQSGFVDDIGFETYHRILDKAVAELRDEEFRDLFDGDGPKKAAARVESVVDLDVDALIPASYVGPSQQRLDLYRRLGEATSTSDIEAVLEEMIDRFGPVPEVVINLTVIAQVRLQSEALRLPRTQYTRKRLFLTLPRQDDTLFFSEIFQPLLKKLNGLGNRYVIKETGTKTRLIVQDVPDFATAVAIMEGLQP